MECANFVKSRIDVIKIVLELYHEFINNIQKKREKL